MMIEDRFFLKGKVALVIGGSWDLGWIIALRFTEAGTQVALLRRTRV